MKLTNALGSGMVERPSNGARLALRSSIHGTIHTGWSNAVLARARINCSKYKQSSVSVCWLTKDMLTYKYTRCVAG